MFVIFIKKTASDAKNQLTAGTNFRTSVQIKNLGVPGREIPRFEYEMKQAAEMINNHLFSLNTLKLEQKKISPCPQEPKCSDGYSINKSRAGCQSVFHPLYLWIMLGTNDLLSSETITAVEVAGRMKAFLDYLTRQECFQNGQLKIRLIAPPRMQPGTWVSGHARTESARLGDCMKAIVPAGVAFTDAGQWELPVCFDGVHLTESGHQIFAENLFTDFINPREQLI